MVPKIYFRIELEFRLGFIIMPASTRNLNPSSIHFFEFSLSECRIAEILASNPVNSHNSYIAVPTRRVSKTTPWDALATPYSSPPQDNISARLSLMSVFLANLVVETQAQRQIIGPLFSDNSVNGLDDRIGFC